MLAEMLEIVLTPTILGLPEIRDPRLNPFQPNGKSAPGGNASKNSHFEIASHLFLKQNVKKV